MVERAPKLGRLDFTLGLNNSCVALCGSSVDQAISAEFLVSSLTIGPLVMRSGLDLFCAQAIADTKSNDEKRPATTSFFMKNLRPCALEMLRRRLPDGGRMSLEFQVVGAMRLIFALGTQRLILDQG